MTDKFDERKYIHPLVQAILDEKRISRKDYVLLGPLAFASFERLRDEWEEAGRPLLTDEAKAILQAVEEKLNCELCSNKDYCQGKRGGTDGEHDIWRACAIGLRSLIMNARSGGKP